MEDFTLLNNRSIKKADLKGDGCIMRNYLYVLMILIVVATCGTVFSKDKKNKKDQTLKAVRLNEIVVTATRHKTKVFETPRSVDVVNKKTIEFIQPRVLPDALSQSTGVFVQKTNRGAGAPIIRGMIGPENLILIDGVRFNNSTFRTGPNQYLAMINPWIAQRIEVLRGNASVFYGSDAIGGVINVITQDPVRLNGWNDTGDAIIRAETADTSFGGTVKTNISTPNPAFLISGGGDIFRELRDGSGLLQPESGYQRIAWSGKMLYPVTKNIDITGAYFGNMILNAGRTDRLNQGRLRYYDNTDNLAYLRMTYKGHGILDKINFNLSYHRTSEVQRKYRCKTDYAGVIIDKEACIEHQLGVMKKKTWLKDVVHTPGAFLTATLKAAPIVDNLVLGTEVYYDYVLSQAKKAVPGQWQWVKSKRGNFSDGSSYLNYGLFAYLDRSLFKWDKGDSRLTIGAGTRFSYMAASAPDVPGIGDVKYSYSGVVASANVSFILKRALNLYFDFSQGFRAPNLQETTVLGDTGNQFEVPNDKLKPVHSNSYEVGLKIHYKGLDITTATFYTKLTDMFERQDVPQTQWQSLGLSPQDVGNLEVVKRVNAAKGVYKGVESSVYLTLSQGIRVRGNLTWTIGDVTDSKGKTQPARRVPPLFGLAGFGYYAPDGRYFMEFYVQGAMGQHRLNKKDKTDLRICEDPIHPGMLLPDCKGSTGWVTLNIIGGYRFSKNFYLQTKISNLTDEYYKTYGSGIYSPGLDASLLLHASW